jgi:hypothetical protein
MQMEVVLFVQVDESGNTGGEREYSKDRRRELEFELLKHGGRRYR